MSELKSLTLANKKYDSFRDRNAASAIKDIITAPTVWTDMASPIEHDILCRLKNKNLIQNLEQITPSQLYSSPVKVTAGCTYTASCSGTPWRFYIKSVGNEIRYDGITQGCCFTFTARETEELHIQAYWQANRPDDAKDLQLEIGSDATKYTPHISDFSQVKVSRLGANLANVGQDQIDEYKTITLACILPAGRYTISTKITSTDVDKAKSLIQFIPADTGVSSLNVLLDRNKSVTQTIDLVKPVSKLRLFAGDGYASSAGDIATYADFILSVKPTPFTPYIQAQVLSPASDGTVSGMTSASPCMTILTDMDGILIEAEYNADTQKYIHRQIQTIKMANSAV